ncbi:CHAT domain-containing protein [Spirosoma jeollabukense]
MLDNIGMVYWQKKQYTTAIKYYQLSLDNIAPGLSKLPITKLPEAKLIRIASQKEYVLSLIQDKADTWLDYAKATNNSQRFQYALDTYKVADQMIDFMRWEHTGQLSKLYWREKTRSMYERAIETCYRLNDTVQAFRFFEKSRAVMLADKLNELGARQKLTQNQIDKENELRKAVNDQQSQLAGLSPDTDSYKSARMELFAKQERLDAFLKQLEISNPAYYRYKYDTTITALADLRSRLNTQKASFVTYFVGDSALYVLGVTATGVKVLRRPVSGYQQATNEFMSLLWKPEAMNRKANFDKFLKSGHGLYQRLLAPLNLPAGRVIVSPDGSFVPFETLSRKIDMPDYLVKDFAFSYIYSARLLLKKNGNLAKYSFNQLDFLGIAPVDFAPSLKQVMLPGSSTALDPIARRFNSSKLLTHGAATRQAFLIQAANARVIHLFTHATADSSDQDEPRLYFADSTLQLSELSDRTLPNTQLVVLAACKTGIGANQRGEGVFSLARGFAALGVSSVLTTLWSVQNDATYQLTNLFYKHLEEGLPKDIALQLAKKEWLETADGANQLPNYWAGLLIVGDTEPLPNLYLALWGSFLLVLLLAAAVIGWYEIRTNRITPAVSLPQPV